MTETAGGVVSGCISRLSDPSLSAKLVPASKSAVPLYSAPIVWVPTPSVDVVADVASPFVVSTGTDVFGNVGNNGGANTATVKIDTGGPTTHISGGSLQILLNAPIRGTVADALSGPGIPRVTFTPLLGAPVTRAATCAATCATWTVSTRGLLGTYTVTAATTDTAGNAGAASNQVSAVIIG